MADLLNLLNQLLWRSGDWVRGYIEELALALVAVALVVFGHTINRHFARLVRPYPWALRFTAFVLLCIFGYGYATAWATPLLVDLLLLVPTKYLGLLILAVFLAIAGFAERNNQL